MYFHVVSIKNHSHFLNMRKIQVKYLTTIYMMTQVTIIPKRIKYLKINLSYIT